MEPSREAALPRRPRRTRVRRSGGGRGADLGRRHERVPAGAPERGRVAAPVHAPGPDRERAPRDRSHGGQPRPAKSVVLAIDRSQSMAGASIRNATAAGAGASSTRSREPTGSRWSSFGHRAVTLGRLLAGDERRRLGPDGIEVDSRPGTALYDAVVAAAELLGKNGTAGRVIIVLTDGHDVSSSATLADAVAAARAAHAAVYPIGIASHDFDPAAPAARAADERDVPPRHVERGAALRVRLDRRRARPHLAAQLRDRRPPGRPRRPGRRRPRPAAPGRRWRSRRATGRGSPATRPRSCRRPCTRPAGRSRSPC